MTPNSLPAPLCPPVTRCKLCDHNEAVLCGVVDFNKSCEDNKRRPLPLSGIPIYYHRCRRCRLIFTVAFDHFSNDDFLTHIYNDGYAAVDPDYAIARPTANASMLNNFFGEHRRISVLDYGGGNGTLAGKLRQAGFADVTTYDPFVAEFQPRPERKFDLIVCFEVVEHSNRPAETFDDLSSLLKPDGLLMFSTLLQPANVDALGTGWWYLAPRNGHVTLYSRESLQLVFVKQEMNFSTLDGVYHIAWRGVPAFAGKLMRK